MSKKTATVTMKAVASSERAFEQAITRLGERIYVLDAQLYLVSDALVRLLAFVDRIGGYTEPDDQAAIRSARAALAEVRR